MNLEFYCEALLKKLPPDERAALEGLVARRIDAYAGTNPIRRARRLAGIDRTTLMIKAIHLRSLLWSLNRAAREGRMKSVVRSGDGLDNPN